MSFPYKNVLITGATSGIGQALAERMIADGIFVIAVGRRKERLDELVTKHGHDKVAGEAFELSDLDAMGAWVKKITSTYPKLDAVILNAGFQEAIDFTNPSSVPLPTTVSEMTTNYLSPLHLITHLLPHLISVGPSPASIVFVSSGLAFVPLPRCPNYCATKAAVHSLAWSMRTQLSGAATTKHIKVVEVIPPAVQTELHTRQGMAQMGVPLEEYANETWRELKEGEKDEIVFDKSLVDVEAEKRKKYGEFLEMLGIKSA